MRTWCPRIQRVLPAATVSISEAGTKVYVANGGTIGVVDLTAY
jgi:hypothetical protein